MTSTGGGDVHDWGPLVGDLAKRRERALGMGGEQFVERQRSLGKLTVRERLDLLLDPGSWVEYGMLADHMDPGLGHRYRRDRRPAGGGGGVRLQRDGGVDGRCRREQDPPYASPRDLAADPDGL